MGHNVPQTGACGLAARIVHFSYSPLISLTPFLTGTLPNITRNAIVNCAEMVTYDVIKEKLLDYHLLTGEALGSRQTALPQQGGNPGLYRVDTTQRRLGFRRSVERGSAQYIIMTSRKEAWTGGQGPGFQADTTSSHAPLGKGHLLTSVSSNEMVGLD